MTIVEPSLKFGSAETKHKGEILYYSLGTYQIMEYQLQYKKAHKGIKAFSFFRIAWQKCLNCKSNWKTADKQILFCKPSLFVISRAKTRYFVMIVNRQRLMCHTVYSEQKQSKKMKIIAWNHWILEEINEAKTTISLISHEPRRLLIGTKWFLTKSRTSLIGEKSFLIPLKIKSTETFN